MIKTVDFNYQLTVWENDLIELDFAMQQIKKYSGLYTVKENQIGQYAVFTPQSFYCGVEG